MSTARERVQQQARRESDAFLETDEAVWATRPEAFRTGFVAGRIASVEMIEHAAEAINEELVDRVNNDEMFIETDGPDPAELERTLARAAFTAAGFIVEKGD